MMARLLKLKKLITKYFRKHSNSDRKLTAREWLVTNEVCSLLDLVAEVTTPVRGSVDTHISQTMFNMKEVKEVLEGEEFDVRTPEQAYAADDVSTVKASLYDLTPEAQAVRAMLLEGLESKELGQANTKAERICALLDPRRKSCSAAHLVNGGPAVQAAAETDLHEIANSFVDVQARASSSAAAPSAGGPAGAAGLGGSPEPPHKKKRLSVLEQRRKDRLAQAKGDGCGIGLPGVHTRRSMLIQRELRIYLAQDEHPEEDDFSVLEFWRRRRKAVTFAGTGEANNDGVMPSLALIARLFHGIESSSCQAERNFSTMGYLVGPLVSSMLPCKVERMMFLRLNRRFIPEVRALHDAAAGKQAAAVKCARKVGQVQVAAEGAAVERELML